MTKRRNFSDKFKATVALEALRGDKTVQEIASYQIPDSISRELYQRQKNSEVFTQPPDKVTSA